MPIPNVSGISISLPTPISIDGGADHGTFLPNMRAGKKSAAAHHTSDAALLNVVGATAATLVGHGQTGIINTGRGDDFGASAKLTSISIDNTAIWTQLIAKRPKTIRSLMLFGCNVGAGKDGARLVWELAKALGATVTAPLGLVWCEPPNFQPSTMPNETFQTATPNMALPPEPKLATSVTAKKAPGHLFLADATRFLKLPIDSVTDVRFRSRDRERVERWHSGFTASQSRGVVQGIAFDTPLIFPGPLATLVTGRLFLTHRFLGKDITREFLIHNDLLIEDTSAPGVFYEIEMSRILESSAGA